MHEVMFVLPSGKRVTGTGGMADTQPALTVSQAGFALLHSTLGISVPSLFSLFTSCEQRTQFQALFQRKNLKQTQGLVVHQEESNGRGWVFRCVVKARCKG